MLPESAAEVASVPEAPAVRTVVPSRADLSGEMPLPRAQSSTDTCVSWAATYAAASHWFRRHGGPDNLVLSPAFTYPAAGGGKWCQGGTKLSRTLDVLRDQGALPLEDYRFDPGWCGREPTRGERVQALAWRIPGWMRLPADLARVKEQLAAGRPVLFAVPPINATFARFRGDSVFNNSTPGSGTLGHSMTLVGYDDERRAFQLINSWGHEWGDGGYAWYSYDLWQRQVNVAFVIGRP